MNDETDSLVFTPRFCITLQLRSSSGHRVTMRSKSAVSTEMSQRLREEICHTHSRLSQDQL